MTVRATAFGLDVECETPILLLSGATADATGRALEVSLAGSEALEPGWPDSAALICDERTPDGTSIFQVEFDPDAGYLISGPDYGTHRLSAGATQLRCNPVGTADAAWQRLLISQVLPLASLLRGLEVFHASAVVSGGQAIAFLGGSGAGKTSMALELCRRGASFLADDVLALELHDGRLLAHPGTPVAGVAHPQAGVLETTGPAAYNTVAVNARERLVRVAGAREPAELAALFFLERRSNGPASPRFEPAVDAQMLLGATFNLLVTTPERLRGLLEVCTIAARLRVEQIVCSTATSVEELGAAVELQLAEPR
jgi:hypothetical protein